MQKKLFALGVVSALTAVLALPAVVGVEPVTDLVERHVPRPAGTQVPMTLFFGPFVVPPGQDMNRVTVDLPLHDGFITRIAPNLADAATGEEPSDLEMHIHHAHWFRVSDDPNEEYYALNLAWIFGTGEEKTQGSLDDRSAAEPDGPRYGIFIPGMQPQALVFMLHNKLATARVVHITLEVEFVHGAAEAIAAAAGCPGLDPAAGERCAAGEDFHAVTGKLWGTTFDVPREADGDGEYAHPRDIPEGDPTRRATDHLGRFFTASWSGTVIATAGHLHPNGKEVVVANLGKAGSGCERDLDGDGYPGVTVFRSAKIERVPEAWPHSEEYQMAASQFGFRAPIRQGDRITQFGVYANRDHATYEAMSFVGLYVDREQAPPRLGPDGCTAASLGARLVDDPAGDPTRGILNHAWHHDPLPLCGPGLGPTCDAPETERPDGLETDTVHVAGFAYVPGDLALDGVLGAPPRVKQGTSLRFVNDDAALLVRHSVTSCPWPCNGQYVANYPLPDGAFDSGKLGNLDYLDGGVTGDDTVPAWETPSDLPVGLYSYYCRIHPTMRGAFEVVE